MGLDMYLTARRYLRTWGDDNDIELMDELNTKFGLDPIDKENPYKTEIGVEELIFDAAYWRKANQIHAWFVKNVQDNEDDCKEYYVDREKLRELIHTCQIVLNDRSRTPDLLPSQSGFFFGSTEYNEWYFEDLEYTVKQLEKVLATPAFERCDFYYQSSW
jgi:hypothetical protein